MALNEGQKYQGMFRVRSPNFYSGTLRGNRCNVKATILIPQLKLFTKSRDVPTIKRLTEARSVLVFDISSQHLEVRLNRLTTVILYATRSSCSAGQERSSKRSNQLEVEL